MTWDAFKQRTYCKKYYQAHRDEVRKRQKEYSIAHRQDISERNRNHYRTHHEECLLRVRNYRIKNVAHITEVRKKYYDAHKEEMQKRAKIYRLVHQEELRLQQKLHYALHGKQKREYSKRYGQLHREERRLYRIKNAAHFRLYRANRSFSYRKKALIKLSQTTVPFCENCGCTDIRVLNINHLTRTWQGRRPNSELDTVLYRRILQASHPEKQYNILCVPCNWIYYWEQKLGVRLWEIQSKPILSKQSAPQEYREFEPMEEKQNGN